MKIRLRDSSWVLLAPWAILASCGASGQAPSGPDGDRVTARRSVGEERHLGPEIFVTGPQGQPLADVEVWLIDSRTVQPERAVIASRTLGDWVKASRAMATEVATTDGGGLAGFSAPQNAGFLVAASRGALFGLIERVVALPRDQSLTLQLIERSAYPVLVRSATGVPAAGVALTLAAPDPATPDQPFALPSTAITDERGWATLFEPPAAATRLLEGLDQVPERVALLRLPAEGLVPAELRTDGERTEITLPPLGSLEIRCRHAGFSEDHWAGLVQVFPATDGTRSDRTLAQPLEGGRLGLPFVSRSRDLRLLAVVSEADAPERFIGTLMVEAPGSAAAATGEAADRVVELPLDAGLILTGRCLDSAGSALANQTVDLFVVGDASASWTQVTDREGRFRWLLLRPGKSLAKIVVGARASRPGGDVKATQRLGDVVPGQVVDLGVLTLR